MEKYKRMYFADKQATKFCVCFFKIDTDMKVISTKEKQPIFLLKGFLLSNSIIEITVFGFSNYFFIEIPLNFSQNKLESLKRTFLVIFFFIMS